MALTVAGWVAESFIKSSITKAVEIAVSQLAQRKGIVDNIQSLKNSLLKVQLVLRLAEERQTNDLKELHEHLQLMMKELKLVAYEAEDLLDEVNYDILKQKIEHEERKKNQSAGNFSMTFVANQFKNVFSSDGTKEAAGMKSSLSSSATNVRNQAADIQSRLETLAEHLNDVIQILPKINNKKRKLDVIPRRETGCYSYETELFGRQEQLEQVRKLLTDGSGTSCENFSVITLCGIGGVGKTTLAQFLYNDKIVQDHFDSTAWLCISDCFDERRITKEIIGHISMEEYSDVNLNILQSTLKKKIMSKKLLVVLDDMWNEDRNKWERLCAPLRYAAPGSKILLTTRLEIVANNVSSRDKIIFLKGLEEDAFWKLFEKCVFGTLNFEENTNLEALGRKIAKNLNGSPLASKTIGSILSRDLSIEHWTTIMESKLWELPQSETDILPALYLSYEYLPSQLKECFSYCSLFPKDYEILKDDLVYMWMSQGLILPQNNRRLEDVGFCYIDNLTSSCLFENVFNDPKKIKMHDLIHDLAEFVSKDENFRIINCESRSLSRIINLSLDLDHLEPSAMKDICNRRNIFRTLIVPYRGKWIKIGLPLDDTFTSLKSIRTLTLASCGIKELPDSISNLKYLSYLDISRNEIETLPDTLCNLYNLQYLNISHLPLKCFPTRMCNLINLRYIKSHSDYEHDNFMCAINDVGEMTSLQLLTDFKVSYEQGRTLSEVKNLRQLHGSFCLWGLEGLESRKSANDAMLNEKKFLDELALVWDANPRNYENDVEVIEGLQPHSNIKSLSIKSFGGALTPSWLDQFVWLRINKLKLSQCHNLEKVECLGQLPYLKFLDMRHMNAVKIVSHGHCSELKNLEEIYFEYMPEWEKWIVPEGKNSFSCLRKLSIFSCSKLNAIPVLKELEVNSNDSSLLPVGCLNALTSLKELKVTHCPNLNPISQNNDAIFFPPSITELWLLECGYVEKALQGGCLQRLTSLNKLAICAHDTKSNEIRLGLFLPSSIGELHLICVPNVCGPLKSFVHGLTSCPYELYIYGCSRIDSLPMDLLHNFTRLRHLFFSSCYELRSIEGLQVVTSLRALMIEKCPKLTNSVTTITKTVANVGVENYGEEGLSSLMLEWLSLDDPRLLKLPPLQSALHSLQTLRIFKCEESVILNDNEDRELLHSLKSLLWLRFLRCWSLQSVPSGLYMPPFLEHLDVDECPNLQSLPVERFPPSLNGITVKLEYCHPKLKEQLQNYKQEKQKRGELFDLYFV